MATRKIADYTITRELGRGGMGTVYQALSPDGATVAVKTVRWPEGVDPRLRWEVIERFQREARAARSLTHPNICQVLDCGADEDSLYIVMEFLDGETVQEIIEVAGGIRTVRAVEIVRGVGEALAHAHAQGIIHRDIKPGNIMVLRGGQVKLTDFGLASVVRDTSLTTTGGTMGTIHYMSPEQVRGEKVDARSDIFSLGATFYEMLAGGRPFQAEEPAAVMNQILTLDPPPIPGLAADVSRTIERCLRKDPQERFQSTRELITSLTPITEETGSTALLPEAERAPPAIGPGRRPWVPRALRRWPVLAAAGVVVALGALALFRPSVRPGGQPTTTEVTAEAPSTTAEEVSARPKPPPPLDTPELEEKDVRDRANFRYPEDKEFTEGREWFEWFVVGPSDSGVTTVEDDSLVLTGAPPYAPRSPHWSEFRGALVPCEFVVEARITKLEGPDDSPFGFMCHSVPNAAYIFLLTGNQDVSMVKQVDSEFKPLAHVEGAPEVNPGDAENVLKVVRRHGRLHMFVNGKHVLQYDDFELGAMTLSLVIRPGVRVAFSDISVVGISSREVADYIHAHMAKLETREALEKLDYLRLYLAEYVSPEIQQALASFDRRATVLVVVPAREGRELYDAALAERLVAKINEKGAGREFHRAAYVTDAEVIANETYREFPLITLEPPDWNKWADELKRSGLPRNKLFSTDEISICHDITGGDRRIALWGDYGESGTRTAEAVDVFIDKLLDRYLEMIWGEE